MLKYQAKLIFLIKYIFSLEGSFFGDTEIVDFKCNPITSNHLIDASEHVLDYNNALYPKHHTYITKLLQTTITIQIEIQTQFKQGAPIANSLLSEL